MKYPSSRMTFCLARPDTLAGAFAGWATSSGVRRPTANPTSAWSSNFSMIVRPEFGCSWRNDGLEADVLEEPGRRLLCLLVMAVTTNALGRLRQRGGTRHS